MIENPHLLEPSAASAWAEGFTKGFTALSSPEPSENVSNDDILAFEEGVDAGSECAVDGIAIGDGCLSALEKHSSFHGPSMAINAAEIAHGLWEAALLTRVAAGIAGIVVAFVELACTLPVHTLPPEQELPRLGQPVVDALVGYGMDSIALFCGAGVDVNANECEIKITPLFPAVDQAREAVLGMNRPQWIVASWRTDQSNSFRVEDSD